MKERECEANRDRKKEGECEGNRDGNKEWECEANRDRKKQMKVIVVSPTSNNLCCFLIYLTNQHHSKSFPAKGSFSLGNEW